MAGEQLDVLGTHIVGHAVRRGLQVQQPPVFRLLHPGLVIAVAVEDDALVAADHVPDQVVEGGLKILCLLQHIGVLPQRLGHRGVQHHVGAGDGSGGAQHPELELVAGEGEGGGAVAVGGVLGELGQHVDAHLDQFFLHAAVGFILLDGLQDALQLLAQEDTDNGGGRLAGAQPVVVAGGGHGNAQHILIIVHCLNHSAEEQQKLGVFIRGFARLQQVDAGVGDHGPVVVLAAAVNAGEGLLMQQAHHVKAAGQLLHQLHGQLVVVGGDVGGGEYRSQLVLGGGGLVVLGLGHNTQAPQLLIQGLHEGGHPGLDGAEIMVVQLLPLGGLGAEEGAPGVDQVLPLFVHVLIYQEVLLLRANGGLDGSDLRVAEELQHPHTLAVDGLHGAQQGGLFIQRLPAVGAEGGGDAQHVVLDKGVGGGVPGGVAPGLKGGPQAAGGEGAGVRLSLDQLLAGKLHDHLAPVHRGDEAVMLLGGDAGHGLEPVGEVGGPLLNGPVLHGVGHHGGGGAVQPLALVHGALHLFEHILGQAGAHHGVVEDVAAEDLGNIYLFHHSTSKRENL